MHQLPLFSPDVRTQPTEKHVTDGALADHQPSRDRLAHVADLQSTQVSNARPIRLALGELIEAVIAYEVCRSRRHD